MHTTNVIQPLAATMPRHATGRLNRLRRLLTQVFWFAGLYAASLLGLGVMGIGLRWLLVAV